uniref:Uncharacterized protein n=1 Tax=Arundo donax TaxID=35708 RepID=A0A0A9A2E4_ARUDO
MLQALPESPKNDKYYNFLFSNFTSPANPNNDGRSKYFTQFLYFQSYMYLYSNISSIF